jgi:hypothetical protein
MFYKRRNYDLSDVLKSIRSKKQQFSKFSGDSYQLENTYWSLICIVFTTLFVARQDSEVLSELFTRLMTPNTMDPNEFETFKMGFDIVGSVLKRTVLIEDESSGMFPRYHKTEPDH